MTTRKFEDLWKIITRNHYEIADNNDADVLCRICHSIMIDSCNAPCGCRYCRVCITNYLDGQEKFCPSQLNDCKDDLINFDINILQDQPINAKISRLLVKCPHRSCEYESELRKIEEHTRMCTKQPTECLYFKLGCGKCDIISNEMSDHLSMENTLHTKLLLTCIEKFKMEMESLKTETLTIKNDYENLKDQRTTKLLHGNITSESIQELIPPFSGQDEEAESIELVDNADLEEEKFKDIEEFDELTKKNFKNSEQIVELREETQESEHLVVTRKFIERKFSKFKMCLLAKQEQINKQIEKVSRDIENMTMKTIKSFSSIQDIESKINDLYEEMCDIETFVFLQNHGEFLWKVEEFNSLVIDVINWTVEFVYSSPFYSHKDGYKMCLKLYPNGCGRGKQSDLSIFFCIMQGPFDDFLKWPFEYDVTLSLINQKTGLNHKSKTKICPEYRYLSNFCKPTNEISFGIGFSEFINIDEVIGNKELCLENRIIIKCVVDAKP